MNVAKRTRDLKAKVYQVTFPYLPNLTNRQLLDLRLGPGASILPSGVKRIHLDFAVKYDDGHLGARRLWRNCLPRLKYHNPAVSMTVNRHNDQKGHSILTVFFTSPLKSSSTASPAPSTSTNSSTKASEHSSWDRTETIDMKHKPESEILSRLMDLTYAVRYEPSGDERAELEEVAEDEQRRERDRERQIRFNEIKRQELALLEEARGSTS